MKRIVTRMGMLAAILSVVGVVAAQTSYPYITIDPESPSPKDTVALQVILGTHPNSCVPRYTTDYVIEKSAIEIYPPQYLVRIRYEAHEPPSGTMCLAVITRHGPRYSLPDLNIGSYVIMDGKTRVGSFSVTAGYELSGQVMNDPYPARMMSRPIEGAKVYLSEQSTADSPAIIRPSLPVPVDSAFTDSLGLFSFAKIPEGRYIITVSAENYKNRRVSLEVSGDTSVTVKLLRKGAHAAIEGTVTEVVCGQRPGAECVVQPVAQCTLSMRVSREYFGYVMGIPPKIAVTDEKGIYRFDSIPLDYNGQNANVSMQKAGYAGESKTATLQNTMTSRLDFQIERQYANAESVTVDGVIFILASEKSLYEPGDAVRMRYSIHNNTMATVTYNFSSGCQYSLNVLDGEGGEIFRYPLVCTDMLSSLSVESGETVSHRFEPFELPENAESAVATGQLIGYDRTALELNIPIYIPTRAQLPSVRKATGARRVSVAADKLTVNLHTRQMVRMDIYDCAGRRIAGLSARKVLEAGSHDFAFSKRNMRQGAYIVRICGEAFTEIVRFNHTGS